MLVQGPGFELDTVVTFAYVVQCSLKRDRSSMLAEFSTANNDLANKVIGSDSAFRTSKLRGESYWMVG